MRRRGAALDAATSLALPRSFPLRQDPETTTTKSSNPTQNIRRRCSCCSSWRCDDDGGGTDGGTDGGGDGDAARTVRRPTAKAVLWLVSATTVLSIVSSILSPYEVVGMKAAVIGGWAGKRSGRRGAEVDDERCGGGDGGGRSSSLLARNRTAGVVVSSSSASSSSGGGGATVADVVGSPEARVEVADVPTSMRADPIPATVILPGSYPRHLASDDEEGRRSDYPVLYVLHGAGDVHSTWLRRVPSLLAYSTRHGLVVVCPDGGRTSWYLDSHLDASYRYETFVYSELVRYVDSNYRTRPNAAGRAIMGNSMGGHGALYLTMKHPEVFGTAVSLSGGVDLRPFHDRFDLEKRLGPLGGNEVKWENATVLHLARTLPLSRNTELGISIDCGAGDFFLEANRELHRVLEGRGIPHEYAERPGGHGWEYWRKAVRRQMAYVDERLNG